MTNIKVLKGGFFTTIQDIGRWGYQNIGMPVAGVMDNFSYRVANYLVGNSEREAVLEVTFLGPKLKFLEDMVIAITGAGMNPKVNDTEISMWKSFKVSKGDVLSLGAATTGIRSYIAFGGKIDVEPVNSSKSTYAKSGIGGFKGRRLLDNDGLNIKVFNNRSPDRYLDKKYIPEYSKKNIIRVILGPQDDYFTEEGLNSFFNPKGYKITNQSDRMGYRLEGEIIEHKEKADIISDGTVFGSIQVPANKQPIILMADRQTTGGYTKIATVISSDLPKLAQMSSGDEIIFKKVSVKESHKIYREFEHKLSIIKDEISKTQKIRYHKIGPLRKMKITINGINYIVDVQEVK
ncbi:biotin-dependent carboxyltransferase family protein [Schnuerera sp. xch1]|uniref:5-oxoprolinase subunit C family protein n=1 Tax=Schnuerera sp. xch1 TaxID=2874283 RepID=UPI001CBD2475|nr:biotin-dependent carboxyltransferase family protein [Schnuerera sp. xch1]MBZ2175918.1 biotin-dependent carboxyltransferase family protein [Schnuerera sp. xch1]